jgi:flagellar biosynthesis protein FlhA
MIDEAEARRRREEISRYADFYGAMDGAAKFVRGDAVAGLVITAINLVGGFVIGVTQLHLSAGDALRTYSSLSVGDGLVTQIPALIVSTASGLLVTYGSNGTAMAPNIAEQLTREPRSLWSAAGILSLFGFVPGLPFAPFLMLGARLGGLAWWAGRRNARRVDDAAAETPSRSEGAAAPAGRPRCARCCGRAAGA